MHLKCALFFTFLHLVSVHNLFLEVAEGAFLAICENLAEFSPLGLAQLLARISLLRVVDFICHVHDQVDDSRSDLNVDPSFGQFGRAGDSSILFLLLLQVKLTLGFSGD